MRRPLNPSPQARVDWLTFQGKDAESALVDAAKRFAPDEAFQAFDTQCELT